ncbi:phosphoribosyl-AMP cyclohydrolase [Candidatus Carsonella ruddii]|uniref:phosphoribosyl-AMP cyclohydrolase n=1 Tax=Carsonella ruddii TaxID=114186 RepID=A0AAE7KLK3_CARRU|nr:phosphoribosyl-AMP cyclohydrolase [Candidatus Carsonella ruddii]AGS06594.1 phosphoribosyl-AMP cyclohydrolase [Candidatus Carsonella ruddii DC]ALA96843.1 hypothetical protein AMC76_00585 [Candidatus Carsonella ruddii]QLK14072.1 phosphoribosyl-AMP cyclohydrolase [Candidatus Carsonella ruddii]
MNNFVYKIFFLINWKKKIFPVIIQNFFNKKLLMLAWVSKFSILESFFIKKTCFWSRKLKKVWRKGYFSNNLQIINKIKFDCDIDVIVFEIFNNKNNCHYEKKSCFNYFI